MERKMNVMYTRKDTKQEDVRNVALESLVYETKPQFREEEDSLRSRDGWTSAVRMSDARGKQINSKQEIALRITDRAHNRMLELHSPSKRQGK